MNELSKGQLHALYIIGILLAIIIGLIAVEWSAIERLTETLSFALTLASLLLALLAIVYAFLSNSLFSQHIATMTSISREMSDANTQLRQSTDNLRHEVREIPQQLREVGDRVQKTQELVQDGLGALNTSSETEASKTDREATDVLVDEIVKRSSYFGNCSFYMALLSYQRERPFAPFKVGRHTDSEMLGGYIFGWLMALDASMIVNFDGDKKTHTIRTIYIHPGLVEQIKEWAERERESSRDRTISIDTIEAFFEEDQTENNGV